MYILSPPTSPILYCRMKEMWSSNSTSLVAALAYCNVASCWTPHKEETLNSLQMILPMWSLLFWKLMARAPLFQGLNAVCSIHFFFHEVYLTGVCCIIFNFCFYLYTVPTFVINENTEMIMDRLPTRWWLLAGMLVLWVAHSLLFLIILLFVYSYYPSLPSTSQ